MTDPRPRKNPTDLHDEVTALAALYLDDELSPAEFKRLSALLASSPEAASIFNDHCLHARTLRQTLSGRAEIEIEIPNKPDDERQRVVGVAAPAPAAPASLRRFVAPSLYATAAIVLIAAYAAVVYFHNAAPSDIDPPPSHIEPPPVATLIHNTGDLRTPHGFTAEGEDYGRGEYTLASGTAEFMLTNSVNVKLRGNTRMYMRNDMNVALTRGSASFVVPKEAKNFTVHLPGGSRVVDLGTAFTTAVGEDDAPSTVRVTEGEVELHTPTQTLRITAGQLCKIDAQNHATVVAFGSSDWLIAHEDTVLYYPMRREGMRRSSSRRNSPSKPIARRCTCV